VLSCGALLAALSAATLHGRAHADDADAAAEAKGSGLPSALLPKVVSALAPSSIAVGDVATLTITVDAPASVQVSLPEQSFGTLELADRRMRSEPNGERLRTIYELDLLAFEAGALEVPELTLRFVGPNGELDEARSERHRLHVKSLLANEPNAEPKPPTKPVTVIQEDYTLAWVALALAAIALIAFITLFVSRKLKSREKALPPPPPPRPPWEIAFAKLHALARDKEQMLSEQRGEEFIDGVSDALREYLGKRYGFDGLERTTGELVSTLERLRPEKLSLSGVSLLLEQCDLVKFARATPEPEQCDDLFNGALGLVRATVPSAPSAPVTASRPPSAPPPAAGKELGA
jgi:hypothetical protein